MRPFILSVLIFPSLTEERSWERVATQFGAISAGKASNQINYSYLS
jgi:hypothetical protein